MVSALVFTGCDFSKNATKQSFENPYAEVGRVHNQGLDHILADMKALRKPVSTQKAFFNLAENSTRAFVKKRGGSEREVAGIEWGRRLVENAPQRHVEAQYTSGTNASSASGISMLPDSVIAELTSEQEQYVEEIMGLVESSPPVPEFEDQLATLSWSASEELGEERAAVVLKTAAVAKSSYNYWRENLGEWMVAFATHSDSMSVAKTGEFTSNAVVAGKTTAQAGGGGVCGGDEKAIALGSHTEADGTLVVEVTCVPDTGGADDCSELEGCGGFLGGADDVARADVTGAVVGGAAGAAPVVSSPATAPAGAVGGIIVGSGTQFGKEMFDWMEGDSNDDW